MKATALILLLALGLSACANARPPQEIEEEVPTVIVHRRLMGTVGMPAPLCYSGAYHSAPACCAELAIDGLPIDSSCRKHAVPFKKQCGLLPESQWVSCCRKRLRNDEYDWSCRYWTQEQAQQ